MGKSTSDNFIHGISVQTIVSLANAVLQIVVFAILSRLLSKTDFGYYAALMGITMVFMGISDAGIGAAVIQKKNPSNGFYYTAFTISLIVGISVGLVFFIGSPFIASLIIDQTLTVPLRWMAIPLILYSINGYAVSVLRRQLLFARIGCLKVCSYLFSSILGIVIALNDGGVYSLVVLFVCDSILYTILVFCNINVPRIGIEKKEAKGVISFGGWLTLGVIMSSIANQIDKLVLGKWLSVERLGAYNRPSGFISNIIGQITTIFDSVLFPVLSVYQDSRERFKDLLYRSFSLLSTAGIILAVTLFFNSRMIILIFFGEQWLNMVVVLRIASLSAIFMLNNTLADCFFRSFNLVKQGFFIRFIGLALSLAFLYLGAQYDIIGVAVAVLLSNFIVVVIKLVFLCSKSGANLTIMAFQGVRAIIPSLPILSMGLFFEFMPDSLLFVILEGVLFIIILLIELLKYPDFVGQEYKLLLFSKIEPYVNKYLPHKS